MIGVPFHDKDIGASALMPKTGGPSTEFQFWIAYTPDTPPTVANVVIDGKAHPMKVAGTETRPPAGTMYNYSTTLKPGTHQFFYSFASAGTTVNLPFNNVPYTVVVQPFDVTDLTALHNPMVGQTHHFIISYSSPTGKPPKLTEIEIDGVAFTMEKRSDGNYVYTTDALAEGPHYYRFRVSDGTTTGIYEAGLTPNVLPFLLHGPTVTPSTGSAQTTFEFNISYMHNAGLAPTSALVYVDNNPYEMDMQSGDLTAGALFSATTKLLPGKHRFYFVFNDGQTANVDPIGPAYFAGPDVTN
jgi:hypothetical protein